MSSLALKCAPAPFHSAPAQGPSHCEPFIRVVGLRDGGRAARCSWLSGWTAMDDAHDYDGDDCKVLSQARAGFDAILLHGDDAARLGRIVRRWRTLLPGKAIVALVSRPDPAVSAMLLTAGADIVFSPETPALEASAFMAALWRRMNMTRRSGGECLPWTMTRPDQKLTPSERTIVAALAECPGQTVGYTRLLRRLNKPVSVESIRSLQVMISRIRKKVLEPMAIRQSGREGYLLDVGALA